MILLYRNSFIYLAHSNQELCEHLGGAVSIAMYDDRLEIVTPGELHFGITPAKLNRTHESKPWNPIITNVFYRAGIIEKWGSGTLNIINWCKANANPKPTWAEQSGSIALRFFPNTISVETIPETPQLEAESRLESQSESIWDRVMTILASGSYSK
jgi:predicted HTH transcriptional regulator